ncbi:MAG TPA: TldD/PmbA family protein [Candidatus Coatesbacteria bacterium]|nr:TldD/PmbA family protein [Candidatus Coatesbacteria bacterium]
MIGRDRALEILTSAVALGGADALEAALFASETNLTRFANSYIHQNVSKQGASVTLRAVVDSDRVGMVTTNDISAEGLSRAVESAVSAAAIVPSNPRFPGLPGAQKYPEVDSWVEETYRTEAMFRAGEVAKIIAAADEYGFDASGAYVTTGNEVALVNSLGLEAYHRGTRAAVNTTILSATSAGWSAGDSKDVRGLDAAAVGRRAVCKCRDGQHPADLEPAEYDLILEHRGVAGLLGMMGYVGFNGLAFAEGRSFATDKIGEKLFDEKFSLTDDAGDPDGNPLPFDFEGMPKRRVPLVEAGVLAAVVHDRTSAKMLGVESTGHGLPAGSDYGAVPMNLFMAPGASSLEEMVAGTERGLLVTHFHYLNPFLDPMQLLFTGMTRDGTFLVEGGKLARPVKNLRFTESMLRAFSQIEAISSDTVLIADDFSGTRVPAVKFRGFRFTSATEF